jgi:hypothetical protein
MHQHIDYTRICIHCIFKKLKTTPDPNNTNPVEYHPFQYILFWRIRYT